MRLGFLYLLTAFMFAQTVVAPPPTAAGTEFFENRIRPVISRNCFQCHSASANTLSGGLSLDTREGLRRGGASGPAVVPGKPEESVLIRAIRHDGRRMPPSGKLPDEARAEKHQTDNGLNQIQALADYLSLSPFSSPVVATRNGQVTPPSEIFRTPQTQDSPKLTGTGWHRPPKLAAAAVYPACGTVPLPGRYDFCAFGSLRGRRTVLDQL